MCISRTDENGKSETLSERSDCTRCFLLERELSIERAARHELMGRNRVLEDHLQTARADAADLRRQLHEARGR
jgi:hypothetical protein